MKVAIVHDWLPLIAGAEKVLEQILKIYPEADVFTLFDFLDAKDREWLGAKTITTSYLNRLPGIKKYYRKLLPLCPQAIEDFDLSQYELVISTSHVVAKGAITGAHQLHISYVHSPARYAWDLTHQYLKQTGLNTGIKGYLAKKMLHDFRIWDYRTANSVDHFLSNSKYIKRRIKKVYRRDAQVIYPPVDIDRFKFKAEKSEFFLTASRMVPYKKMDLIAEAFSKMPGNQLIIIGDGPEMEKIKAIAARSANIKLLGFQANEILVDHMQRAKAFIFAAEEDFGIIPVEAQACGTPVIAFGAGGALETILDAEKHHNGTGIFFQEQTALDIQRAVERFEKMNILPLNCRNNAENFAPANFQYQFKQFVDNALQEHKAERI